MGPWGRLTRWLTAGQVAGPTPSTTVSEFLWGLLTARSVEVELVRQRAEALAVELPRPYRLVIIELEAFTGPASKGVAGDGLDEAKRRLMTLVQNEALRRGLSVVTAASSDGVVALTEATGAEGCGMGSDLLQVALARGIAVSVVAGRVYHSLEALPSAYQEVQRCQQVMRTLGWRRAVVFAENLGVLQYLPALADLCPGGCGPLHEALQRLVALEESKALNFAPFETLEVYLDSGANAHLAADRLAVHVNTLHYRLRRIVEATGIDLTDGLQRLAIHLELKLRRFASS